MANLNMETSVYQRVYNDLDGYLTTLQSLKNEYETKKGEVSNFYEGAKADKLIQVCETNIESVNRAIQIVQKDMESIQNTLAEQEAADVEIDSSFTSALEKASSVFD